MSVLLLRLAGPLQSWGVAGRFAWRTTASAPTKSGVVGLLASALGRDRDADISDLAALRFGVRIDQPGTRIRDFQTAHHAVTGRSMPLSERFYLADAVFVAAVEGEEKFVREIEAAVRQPAYLPYLGRRSCPPSGPIELGVRDTSLREALQTEPWHAADWYRKRRGQERPGELELLIEAESGDGPADALRDQPVSFDPRHRQYALRAVQSLFVPFPAESAYEARRGARLPDHNPTSLLEEI